MELVVLCVWFYRTVSSTLRIQLCSYPEASTGVLIAPEELLRFLSGVILCKIK